jgi:uncharacterized repeat protein (TIGR01451 family)
MSVVQRLKSSFFKTSLWLMACLAGAGIVWAHSVGQVQTTKSLAPETVNLLISRASGGSPGFVVGDVVSYIIQFTPVNNGADIGVAGYITDYIPPGTEVVDASIVLKDAAGNFVNIPPSFPGGIDDGWGRGQNNFLTPFNTAAYDTTGRCTAAGFANNCNARLSQLHADTGIFYSTDPRTAVFPALPVRINQGNGYDISPTAEGQLNTVIGQTRATTHNLWDADQTNAFGSTAGAVTALIAPKSAAPSLTGGTGPSPYNAGSAVAGPQTGYLLDNTAAVGPWKRIAYPGSRIGDNSTGPATSATGGFPVAISGQPTSVGYNLSPSNPLPAGTNAVRWAVGQLTVGEIRYVKISLRLTAPVPTAGIVNSSEVFGGDAGGADDGKDSVWRYHVPSVADNNSNLLVQKTVKCIVVAGVCTPTAGAYIPANAVVRYQIAYLNAGALAQTNVQLLDVLPCYTAANASLVTAIVSGPIGTPTVNPPLTAAGNNCTSTNPLRSTVTFPILSTLAPGVGGTIEIDIKTNTGNGDLVINTTKLSSDQVPAGVTANAISSVAAAPNLIISKIANTSATGPGGTASYSIIVENVGTASATGIALFDVLPSMGGVANASMRFSYATVTSVVLATSPAGSTLTGLVATTLVPPTLAPYNTLPVASNSQQINWTFASSTLVAGGKFTLTYTAIVGSSVTASATPYLNNAAITYGGGGPGRTDAPSTAPVLIISPLSVAKTIECYVVGVDCITASGSGQIPPNAKVRYRIDYANNGTSAIPNAVLSDTLPCQTAVNAVGNIQIVSGPVTVPAPNPPLTAAGVCPSTRSTFSFPPATLAAGQTGSIKIDVLTNALIGNLVVNTANLSAEGFASTSSDAQASVVAQPELQITKTSPVTAVAPGATLTYTITVKNIGTTAAQTITVYDWLPTSSPTNNVATRFSYVTATTAITGLTSVVPVVNRPPTQAPYNAAGSNPNLNNQEEIVWSFGTQTLAPGASFSITFSALAGSAIPVSAASYDNTARASFAGGAANSGVASAKVTLMAQLSVTKTNGTITQVAGGTTSYTVTFSNLGPSAADGARVKDTFTPGLTCTSITCVATSGVPLASCPSSLLPLGTAVLVSTTNFFTTGETIATFPANSSITLVAQCGVTATGQ